MRSTTNRDKHRKLIRQGEPPCHVCGQPINYKAHHLDPLAFTIDHVTPLHLGGEDVLDNIRPAHRQCNREKSDKPATWRLGTTYITNRHW